MATKKSQPGKQASARAKISKISKRAPAKPAKAAPRTKAAPRATAAKAAPPAKTVPRTKAAPPAKASKRVAKAKTAAGDAPMFQKVAFTLFPITESTRARAFYEDVLGFKRGLAAPNGMWTEYDLPGGGCLALFRHPDPNARKPGGASIAFEVADLDALNERLSAAGVQYQGEMVHGPHCRMSNILDSEGNTIILHQLDQK